MTLQRACKLSELETDVGRGFILDGHAICVIKLREGVYAVHDRCPHAAGKLSGGFVDAGCIECPLHGARFDVRSGQVVSGPVLCGVRTYPVVIESDVVYVEL